MPGRFAFNDRLHEPGTRTVLGRSYPQQGAAQAEAVLNDLAGNPATARHIAHKLARHFIADAPPAALVERLARVFLDSGGHLPALYRALIDADEGWEQPLVKYKTPNDFLLSTLRALRFVPPRPQMLIGFFDILGQRPYTPGSPAGWPDTAPHWDGSDALLKRIEWVIAVGRQIGDRTDPQDLGRAILGDNLSDHTQSAIARADSAAQGLALLFASPEFLRR